MSDSIFVVEILGEGAFHKFLLQSGWSGKDYLFHYNTPTNSHMRAYRSIEEYRAERSDLHKSATVWPMMGNLLPADQIEAHVFVSPPPAASVPVVEVPVETESEMEEASDDGDDDPEQDDDSDDLTGKKFKSLQAIARKEGVPDVEALRTSRELIDAINAVRSVG